MSLNAIADAPSLQLHCHGLVESGNVVARGPGRWENGVQFSPLGCYYVRGVEADCPPLALDVEDALQECVPVIQFRPYVLTVGLEWAANSGDDPEEIARQTLEVGTSAQLEEFLWLGSDAGDGPRNPLLIESTPVGFVETALQALGAVESAMLDAPTGGAGTIYMAPSVAAECGDALYENGGKLYTKATCSLVVVGNFPPVENVNLVIGHVGEVDLYLGDVFFTETRDEYRRNEHVVMAERLAIAAFNSCASFMAIIGEDDGPPPPDEGVQSILGEDGITVDSGDPENPVVAITDFDLIEDAMGDLDAEL
jgi:hypothetical protein